MVLGIEIALVVLVIVGLFAMCFDADSGAIITIVCLIALLICSIFGGFHGFIDYPATEGSQVGIITAVDLEGVWFRRYEIYIKSSGYTFKEDNFSEETKYLIYEDEEELAEQLKNYLGKKVKLNYGHDGGYIGWRSCGKNHIKSVELIEGE